MTDEGIQFKQSNTVYDSDFTEVPNALVFAGYLANQMGTACRVLLDGKEIATVRPHPTHSDDEPYRVIQETISRRIDLAHAAAIGA